MVAGVISMSLKLGWEKGSPFLDLVMNFPLTYTVLHCTDLVVASLQSYPTLVKDISSMLCASLPSPTPSLKA